MRVLQNISSIGHGGDKRRVAGVWCNDNGMYPDVVGVVDPIERSLGLYTQNREINYCNLHY